MTATKCNYYNRIKYSHLVDYTIVSPLYLVTTSILLNIVAVNRLLNVVVSLTVHAINVAEIDETW